MDLDDNRMIEAIDFRVMKKQNAQEGCMQSRRKSRQ